MTTRDLFPQFEETYLCLIHPQLGEAELLEKLATLTRIGQEASFAEVTRLFYDVSWRERLIGLCLAMARQSQQYVDCLLHCLHDLRGMSIVPTCAALAVLSHAGLYELSPSTFAGCDRAAFDGELGWAIDKALYSVGLSTVDPAGQGPNYGQVFEKHVALYHWILTASRNRSDALRERMTQIDEPEFTTPGLMVKYSVVGPAVDWDACEAFVYTTKFHCGGFLLGSIDSQRSIGMLSCGGLPDESALPEVARRTQGKTVHFLGDCDPLDLLLFTWLRTQMSLTYLGINDSMLEALGVSLRDNNAISLSSEERKAFALLRDVCPQFSTLIGPQCTALLDSGFKCELEALISCRTQPASRLLALLD